MNKMTFVRVFGSSRIIVLFLYALAVSIPLGAETRLRINTELYGSAYRGRKDWYFTGSGRADVRFASTGNTSVKAEAAVEFYPIDLTAGRVATTIPAVSLKRLWVKASFPSWRLTLGKTKVAWGNGKVFNSGDILFGSLSPYLNFTQSGVRDDTSFLASFNIPTGRFSYVEGVILPPSISLDSEGNADLSSLTIDHTSGGIRYFFRAGGWRFELGYLYKGEEKTPSDLLGHRPYVAFHGHAGVDLYGALSVAIAQPGVAGNAGLDAQSIFETFNFSLGAFHQIKVGYNSTLVLRLETLVMPGRSWTRKSFQEVLDNESEGYGILIYPEISMTFQSGWTVSLRSIVSPVDGSAQITTGASWNVFQGFTLLGYLVINAGDNNSLFAWDRSDNWPEYSGTDNSWADYESNGVTVTMGAKYTY